MTALNIPQTGQRVRMKDPYGGCVEGVAGVLEWRAPRAFVLEAIEGLEDLEFDLGAGGYWYEINDSQTPWTLEVLS